MRLFSADVNALRNIRQGFSKVVRELSKDLSPSKMRVD